MMEKNIAILMADLSGYTAMTETHGSVSAADLIDKYVQIAEDCLVGDSKMHQRTGDEIMFVSDSPDALLATAISLGAKTASEENFLQVHGGLHYGSVLERADNYFGTTINLAARIATKAAAGTIWCSDEFLNAVTDISKVRFKSKGHYQFKNINGEKEVFELSTEKIPANIDPVCRMLIVNPRNAILHPQDDKLYFCSSECLNIHMHNQKPVLQNQWAFLLSS